MHVELVELLRCLQPHDDTWLVASIDCIENREIVTGTLGCPICQAEYPIRDRVAHFEAATEKGTVPFSSEKGTVPFSEPEADAMRIAAALELTEPRRIAVLQGEWAARARIVHALSPAPLIVLDPVGAVEPGDGVNVIAAQVAPLADGSVAGVALGADASRAMAESLVRALRSGGRMLAPLSVQTPDGVIELARDDDVWVAERLRHDVIPIRRKPH